MLERIQSRLAADRPDVPRPSLMEGLTIAVQDSTAAHLYAEANVPMARLLVCDSFPAAFEHADTGAPPPIDVILGAHPVLEFMVRTTRLDWRLPAQAPDKPLWFTQADYAIVMAEESYALRWFINDIFFRLGETGRLQAMRRRWLDESYAYPRRASTEGLPFDVRKMPAHYAQGTCRELSPRP